MAPQLCLAMQIQERHKNWHRQIYILFTSLLSTESTFCGRGVVLWSRARVNAFLFSSSPQFQSSTTVDEISRWMMTIAAATFYTTTTDRSTELLLLGGVRHALQLLLPPSPKYTTLLLLLLLSSFIPSATELVLLWCSFVRWWWLLLPESSSSWVRSLVACAVLVSNQGEFDQKGCAIAASVVE